MFADFSVASQIGLRPHAPQGDTDVAAPMQRVAITYEDNPGLLSPRNPLFILGLILAITVGAASAAGSVRVGKAKLSVSAGK
jgi:hypothetical protein